MLILNEADFVKHTVPNAAQKVDELIIVDSGSTDKTMDIIRELDLPNVFIYKYTQNCSRYKWKQAIVRNWINEKCIEHGADYIFIQDADELIDCNLHEIIKSEKSYYSFMFYDVVFRQFVKGFGIHKHVRLWKAGFINWRHSTHSTPSHDGAAVNGNKNVVTSDYFFHLHRYNNKPKKDEKIQYERIWGDKGIADFPEKLILPESLIKFWEAKGI